MKKVLAIILTGILVLPALSGCTKVPDWAKEKDIYKETYLALADEFKVTAEKSDNAKEYIKTHDIDTERKERRSTSSSSSSGSSNSGGTSGNSNSGGTSGNSNSGGSSGSSGSGGTSGGTSLNGLPNGSNVKGTSVGSVSDGVIRVKPARAVSDSNSAATAEPVKISWLPKKITLYPGQGSSKNKYKSPEVSDFLKYDASAKIPYFDFTDIDHVDIVRAANALSKVWNDKDIPMFGAKTIAYRNDAWMLEFFKTFKCKSIKLRLPQTYGYTREKLKNSTTTSFLTYSVGDIQNLTTLYVDKNYFRYSTSSDIKPCESLTEMKIPSALSNLPISTQFPKLKKLILSYSGYGAPGDAVIKGIKGTSVEEVDFYTASGGEVTPNLGIYDFFTALKKIKTVKKINGKERSAFVIPMDETTKKQLEARKLKAKNDATVESVTKKCRSLVTKYATSSEEGMPELGKKILVDINGANSIKDALDGKDFNGIPNKRLAKSYKEANTLLMLYASHTKVGYYTNGGGVANRTRTMVITVNLKTKERAAHLIGTTNPPQRITFRRGFGTGASGTFLRDKALKYAKGLL